MLSTMPQGRLRALGALPQANAGEDEGLGLPPRFPDGWATVRRRPDGGPFSDVILAGRTPKAEQNLADHPSLKPQSILRQLVYASLPLGEGVVLDPFMGSGSTLAAAEAIGYQCIGISGTQTISVSPRTPFPHYRQSKPRCTEG